MSVSFGGRGKPPRHGVFETFLRNRELGLRPKNGLVSSFMNALYVSMDKCASWDGTEGLRNAAPGGIFNLEFSLDGSLLVAACEKRSILMFDPLSRKLINNVDNAHNDCVNCVRFLDSRVFATCSDDSTVALWDARNLKSRIRTLNGHSNWVKNIEFSHSDGLLVTSGFDGSIFTWDINSYTESGFVYNRVFHTNGLMRTRLNPDASKMIICTTGGYLILIHNLDLRTLAQDLDGFKPNMYRLMQLSQTTIPVAACFTHLFYKKRKKNRIEFITDFPSGDDAEVVSSLQVHPQGWCALSRNISNDENSEWTCIHDIQDMDTKSDEESEEDINPEDSDSGVEEFPQHPDSPENNEMLVIGLNSSRERPTETLPGRIPRRTLRRQNAVRGYRPGTDRRRSNLTSTLVRSTTDVWEALVALREARAVRERRSDEIEMQSQLRVFRMNSGIESGASREGGNITYLLRNQDGEETEPAQEEEAEGGYRSGRVEREYRFYEEGTPGRHVSARSFYIISRPRVPQRIRVPKNHRIQKNVARLTHYIEESNVGKGFIKELCFSSDGRLICSPYEYGVRLLAFSPDCLELSQCVPQNGPVKLNELSTTRCHPDIVVSTKFSPRHTLLVSGCLSGRIVWHQPVL